MFISHQPAPDRIRPECWGIPARHSFFLVGEHIDMFKEWWRFFQINAMKNR
jgi:hypothetical protein